MLTEQALCELSHHPNPKAVSVRWRGQTESHVRRGTESHAIFSALTSYGLLGVSEGRDPWKSSASCVRLETPSVFHSTPRARAQYVAQKRTYRRLSMQQTNGKYLLHSSVTMNEKEMTASAPEIVAREKPPQVAAPFKA